MHSENGKKHDCTTCKWFYQHFGKTASGYQPVNCGHCGNSNAHMRTHTERYCTRWEMRQDLASNRPERLYDTLIFTAMTIREIAMALPETHHMWYLWRNPDSTTWQNNDYRKMPVPMEEPTEEAKNLQEPSNKPLKIARQTKKIGV